MLVISLACRLSTINEQGMGKKKKKNTRFIQSSNISLYGDYHCGCLENDGEGLMGCFHESFVFIGRLFWQNTSSSQGLKTLEGGREGL